MDSQRLPILRISVTFQAEGDYFIRDDCRGKEDKILVKKVGPHGRRRLTIEEMIGPKESLPERLLPGRNIQPKRPWGEKDYKVPNKRTLAAIQEGEYEGWARLERIRRRKPCPRNALELDTVRWQRKNNNGFRITKDETRPDYYAAEAAAGWYGDRPDPTVPRTPQEKALIICMEEHHGGQEDWSDEKWMAFWKHATSRSSLQDFRKFK